MIADDIQKHFHVFVLLFLQIHRNSRDVDRAATISDILYIRR
jgi:hypothetical protein